MDVTTETIESYFAQYGWAYEGLDDAHFVTGFDSDVDKVFSIYITLTPNWVYFAVSPFVQAPTDPACESKLYKHLLRLCHEVNLAKFSVDADGDVILTVELPRAGLDYSEFADALDALSYYTDEHYLAVRALATDREALSSFSGEEDLDWGE
jgi:hypothetical protein